ncbi:MAG TPA: alpha/beta hydrolase-fold protein, partial [Pyrinomonadaceae bacterium]|nr:alpha/beta hydrolase-fold protein [Pyrinomonadaceae bacterium]
MNITDRPARRNLHNMVAGLVLLLLLSSVGVAQNCNGPTRLKIKSTVLGEHRDVLVRTPTRYEANNIAYPVFYMTDGDAHMGHTSSTIDWLVMNGRMSDMIVVGITNKDRTRDLTPAKGMGNDARFATAGGADNFLKFIEIELIPEIEKRYRVQPYRVLAGHSLGGLFAVHALITRPDLFNAYVAVSPSIQWAGGSILKGAEQFFNNRKELRATLYTSLGNEPGDIVKPFEEFRQLLARTQIKGFEIEAQQMMDEDHGSVVLRSYYFGLRKIYDGWQMPHDLAAGAFLGMKAADEHYKWLSRKFGYLISTPEGLINLIGYQYLEAGSPDEAIATFRTNVERYPDS